MFYLSVFLPLVSFFICMIFNKRIPDLKIEATDITFTIPETDQILAEKIINKIQEKIGFKNFISETKVVKISVIGNAMRTQSGIAKTMFETLAKNQINIHVISTSEIKISVLISSDYYELAMRSLHSAFGLDELAIK